MLYAGSFRDIVPERYDQIWLVVRQLSAVPRNPLGNIRHVRVLSPSKRLLYDTLALKRQGRWNAEAFDNDYAPRFLKEMLGSPEARVELDRLAKLSKSENILIACYCPDERLCHRSLIKKIVDMINS